MKKLIAFLIAVLFVCTSVYAGSLGTVVCYKRSSSVYMCDVPYTDDTTGINAVSLDLPSNFYGWQIGSAVHAPGTALTSTTDVYFLWNSIDIFGGGFVDCGGASNKQADFDIVSPIDGSETVTLSGNSVNGAYGNFYLFLFKQ